MAKLALCMKAENAHPEIIGVRSAKAEQCFLSQDVINHTLTQTDLLMVERTGDDGCEKNPALLQLIPYILVEDHLGDIFSYSRGEGSGEERLKAKMSVGLGGHVDSLPPLGVSLTQHLQEEAARELQEEIGVTVDPTEIRIVGVLVNALTEVDTVHIGLLCRYKLSQEQDILAEDNVIDKGCFENLTELQHPSVMARMENWSKLALANYLNLAQ